MKTRYLAILATLAFLGFSVPAAAHPCDRDPGEDHKHCLAATPQTTFTANIEVSSSSTPSVLCMGTAEDGLDVGFPLDGCPVELDDDRFTPARNYCLFAADVKNTRKETSVMFFFHEPCGVHPGTGVWRTLRLPATIVFAGPGDFTVMEVDGSFDDVVLTKNHQPFKEEPLTDTITVGDIVYTADPPP